MNLDTKYKIDKYILKLKKTEDPYKAGIYQDKIKYYNRLRMNETEKQCGGSDIFDNENDILIKCNKMSDNLNSLYGFAGEILSGVENYSKKNDLSNIINEQIDKLNEISDIYKTMSNITSNSPNIITFDEIDVIDRTANINQDNLTSVS